MTIRERVRIFACNCNISGHAKVFQKLAGCLTVNTMHYVQHSLDIVLNRYCKKRFHEDRVRSRPSRTLEYGALSAMDSPTVAPVRRRHIDRVMINARAIDTCICPCMRGIVTPSGYMKLEDDSRTTGNDTSAAVAWQKHQQSNVLRVRKTRMDSRERVTTQPCSFRMQLATLLFALVSTSIYYFDVWRAPWARRPSELLQIVR